MCLVTSLLVDAYIRLHVVSISGQNIEHYMVFYHSVVYALHYISVLLGWSIFELVRLPASILQGRVSIHI